MRELLADTCTATEEDGASHEYDYYILVSELPGDVESYGIKITGHGKEEGETVPDVTVDFARINELVEVLTRNVVTPAHLRDILEDWL